METKKPVLLFVLAVVGLIFFAVSALVWLTRGRSARWIALKLRYGALLLTLSALLQSCVDPLLPASEDWNSEITCYFAGPSQNTKSSIVLENVNNGAITLPLSRRRKIIRGGLQNSTIKNFSYRIENQKYEVFQKGNIFPLDGKFGEEMESFEIKVNSPIPSGDYILRFYFTDADHQEWAQYFIQLKIR